ncbi:MAG: hypothetical protein KDE27_23110 [Planctomycetes bacterium]|nr:hypothetical protein [Planctomycetota bacterium]
MRMQFCLCAVPTLALAALCTVTSGVLAQTALRGWGDNGYTTEAVDGTYTKVSGGYDLTLVLRQDGRIFGFGQDHFGNVIAPLAPPGLTYVDVAAGRDFGIGLLSDGTIVGWGFWIGGLPQAYTPPPPAPPGTRYVAIDAGDICAVALRSDGIAVSWGSPSFGPWGAPVLPAPAVKVVSGSGTMMALLTTGQVVAWGASHANNAGQQNVPSLPAGLSYTDIAAGAAHGLAVRSDGALVAWGSNLYGQIVVPSLPAGTTYTEVFAPSTGSFSFARRSDGVVVAFGNNYVGQSTLPQLAPGETFVSLSGGPGHGVGLLSTGKVVGWGYNFLSCSYVPSTPAGERWIDVVTGVGFSVGLLSDGTLRAWGDNTYSQLNAPALPAGLRYTQVSAGYVHGAAIRSDGALVSWGFNHTGQCNVPPLPAGVTYTAVSAGDVHTVALRSDGSAIGFGDNTWGEITIPPLPPGQTYTQVDCTYQGTALLRSDGEIVVAGGTYASLRTVPPLPTSIVYTDVAFGAQIAAGLRSDGELELWGPYNPSSPFYHALPPLPFGVVHVQVTVNDRLVVARRSDGQLVFAGLGLGDAEPWPLLPGESYVDVDAYGRNASGRVGPTSTYVTFENGCAGSTNSARLVPRDTPRIGSPLEVTLFDLPQNLAIMLFALARVPRVSLAPYGMPGCSTVLGGASAAYLIAGQNGQARSRLSIPNDPGLVGLRFLNQALVLDSGANNSLGAVLSDAAEGVVGHW